MTWKLLARYSGRERSKVSEISHLKKSKQMEIGIQVNVIPLNTKLSSRVLSFS